MSDLPESLLRRRVLTDAGCWEWKGSRDRHGYGRVRFGGRLHRVHRLACHLVHGLDLSNPSEFALHSCDNPPCFNPDHLRPGSPRDNALDLVARGQKPPVPRKNIRPAGAPLARTDRLCGQGLHRMTEDNIYYSKNGGANSCRACQLERSRRRKRRLQAERFGLRADVTDSSGS